VIRYWSASDPATGSARGGGGPSRTVRVVFSGPAGAHVGKIHNLNAGYQAARGDLIALVDADVQLSAELWNAALAVMADPTVAAAFAPPLVTQPERHGKAPVATGGEMLTALHINHARTAGIPFAALSRRVHVMAGGFMIFHRRVLEQGGGLLHLLDEVADDICLGRVVRENGYQIAVIPVPAHVVPEPETFNEATTSLLRRLTVSRDSGANFMALHQPADGGVPAELDY
jgi:cellulose synthase/poly-beta-1,6-N-acetylglucosamine synthase-like glycosyltransferase